MPISLRRRPRRVEPAPAPPPVLGALSLPDLTVPLVDTEHWPPPVPPIPDGVGLGINGAGAVGGVGTVGEGGRRDSMLSMATSVPKDARLNGTGVGQGQGQSSFGKLRGSPWGAQRGRGHSRGVHGGSAGQLRGSSGGAVGGVGGAGAGGAAGTGSGGRRTGAPPSAPAPAPPAPPPPADVAWRSQSSVDLSGLPGLDTLYAFLPPPLPVPQAPQRQPPSPASARGAGGPSTYASADSLHSKYRQQGQGHGGRAPALVRDANGASPDFHKPFGAATSPPPVPAGLPGTVSARKRAQKRIATLTIMVAGPTGSGKTS